VVTRAEVGAEGGRCRLGQRARMSLEPGDPSTPVWSDDYPAVRGLSKPVPSTLALSRATACWRRDHEPRIGGRTFQRMVLPLSSALYETNRLDVWKRYPQPWLARPPTFSPADACGTVGELAVQLSSMLPPDACALQMVTLADRKRCATRACWALFELPFQISKQFRAVLVEPPPQPARATVAAKGAAITNGFRTSQTIRRAEQQCLPGAEVTTWNVGGASVAE
jgi:hypothetical protein